MINNPELYIEHLYILKNYINENTDNIKICEISTSESNTINVVFTNNQQLSVNFRLIIYEIENNHLFIINVAKENNSNKIKYIQTHKVCVDSFTDVLDDVNNYFNIC